MDNTYQPTYEPDAPRDLAGKHVAHYRVIDGGGHEPVDPNHPQEQQVPHSQPLVAIKLYPLRFAYQRNRALQEAQAIKDLTYPYILPVLEVGLDDTSLYMVSEQSPHGTLRDLLERNGAHQALPMATALSLLSQVAQAVSYAHQQHILHLDLKPENILLNASGDALLSGFTIPTVSSALSLQELHEESSLPYLAPELFQADGKASERSDQYALGCIAYELMTGYVPLRASDFETMQKKHNLEMRQTVELPVPPARRNPQISSQVEEAILTALAKDPTYRHSSVNAFIDLLQAHAGTVSGTQGVKASPATTNELPDATDKRAIAAAGGLMPAMLTKPLASSELGIDSRTAPPVSHSQAFVPQLSKTPFDSLLNSASRSSGSADETVQRWRQGRAQEQERALALNERRIFLRKPKLRLRKRRMDRRKVAFFAVLALILLLVGSAFALIFSGPSPSSSQTATNSNNQTAGAQATATATTTAVATSGLNAPITANPNTALTPYSGPQFNQGGSSPPPTTSSNGKTGAYVPPTATPTPEPAALTANSCPPSMKCQTPQQISYSNNIATTGTVSPGIIYVTIEGYLGDGNPCHRYDMYYYVDVCYNIPSSLFNATTTRLKDTLVSVTSSDGTSLTDMHPDSIPYNDYDHMYQRIMKLEVKSNTQLKISMNTHLAPNPNCGHPFGLGCPSSDHVTVTVGEYP